MAFNENQIGLNLSSGFFIDQEYFFQDVIVDRGSKYSVTAIPITTKEDIKRIFTLLTKKEFYSRASHNSYAYRLINGSSVGVGKNDDGEVGAGMCILRELERANAENMLVIVTRYFGGVHLHGDRFKHVIDAVKILFQRVKKSSF